MLVQLDLIEGLLIAIRGIDMKFSQRNYKRKTVEVRREVGRFHRIVIANVGILLLDGGKHKLD